MSRATQIEFERLIAGNFQRHKNELSLASPTFQEDGFITTATMAGSAGSVEILCGPAEYPAEVFITTTKGQKRWDLADLIGIESVRLWMLHNRPNSPSKSRLEAEIECLFGLIADGLNEVASLNGCIPVPSQARKKGKGSSTDWLGHFRKARVGRFRQAPKRRAYPGGV